MRIAFLTTEYPTETNFDGGLSSYLQRTSRLLGDMGHEVEVFTRSQQLAAAITAAKAGLRIKGGVEREL